MTPVLVTRPAREAEHWVHALQAAGWHAQAMPLIEITPPVDTQSLSRCRQQWQDYDAVMFVSGQAVSGLFGEGFAPPLANMPRCWAPGPGTAKALLHAGVRSESIDSPAPDAEQFDSEALWAVVAAQVRPGFRLLIVRGSTAGASERGVGTGRDWLARQCEVAGAQVDWCITYQRSMPRWSPDQIQAAQVFAHNGSLWLFSSSEAVANLAQLCPGVDWASARAVVTHPRIAQAARGLGFGAIITTRPALADVLQSLSSSR